MIQAQELRIGNWVKFVSVPVVFNGMACYGKGAFEMENHALMPLFKFQGHEYYQSTWENLHPIPLTPDILIKAGFEKEVRGKKDDFDGEEIVYHSHGVDIYDHTENGGGFTYATYTRYPGRGFKGGHSVETVHHLQNLYHALTQTELNISL